MTATVDFIPFATATAANVESQDAYAADAATQNGFSAGLASSAKFNKAMRQATFVAAALATWMSGQSGASIADDGVIANFTANITSALNAYIVSRFTHSFGQSGYQKLPGGFILQWAFTGPLTNQALNTVTFPIAFPNAAFAIVASAGQLLVLSSNQVSVGAAPLSVTQAQIAIAANVSGSTGVYYFAIGN